MAASSLTVPETTISGMSASLALRTESAPRVLKRGKLKSDSTRSHAPCFNAARIVSINASEVAQFGDAVCSAFDSNTSYAHVKAEIMDKVKQIPFTTVAAGAADYVVKTAVKLYCPGYSSRTA